MEMLRQIVAGELHEAIVTVKKDIALPAVLGRVCPELCERACRLGKVDSPAAICQLKRYVADANLALEKPYLPPCKPSTGKKVAIAGAGPAGLTAAHDRLPAFFTNEELQPHNITFKVTDEDLDTVFNW